MHADADRALRIALLVALGTVMWLVAPFADALLVAAVVAILAWPIQGFLAKRLRRSFATALSVVALTLGILGPLATILAVVSGELVGLVNQVVAEVQGGAWTAWVDRVTDHPWFAFVASQAGGQKALAATLQRGVGEGLVSIAAAVSQNVPGLVSLTAVAAVKITIFYLAVATLLHRGPDLLAWGLRVSPLREVHTGRLYEVFAQFARNVVFAGLMSGVIQGAVAGLGYTIVGVDRPLLFAVLTGLLAYVPFVGTALVWVPLSILLVAQDRSGAAIGLVAWSVILTASVDNFVKPLLVKGRSDIPAVLVFLGVFGGLIGFGVIGVLLGPVLVAMLLALFKIYEESLGTKPP